MYAIWRSCERLGVLPPEVKDCWEDNSAISQAFMLAYSQVRECEEAQVAGSRALAT